MFQFPGFAFSQQVFNLLGCPIRTSADQSSFASPRSFSQLTTSFVASESLGIPRTPLFASCSSYLLHNSQIRRSFAFGISPNASFLSSQLVNELF